MAWPCRPLFVFVSRCLVTALRYGHEMDAPNGCRIRQLECGLVVSAPAQHTAEMRRRVHQLKYQASPSAARMLGLAIAEILPVEVSAIVPVPRATVRKWRYGVDPAYELARVAGRACGVPVQLLLAPAMWWPAHVGSSREQRTGSARFRSKRRAMDNGDHVIALLDDVVTTGGTLSAAARCLAASGVIDGASLVGVAATLA